MAEAVMNPKVEPAKTQEAKKKEKEKAEYKMPTISIGDPIVWFLLGDGRRRAGQVTVTGERTISCFVQTNAELPIPAVKSAVRHVSDPVRNQNDIDKAGFWDYTEEFKAVQRRLDSIEDMLSK